LKFISIVTYNTNMHTLKHSYLEDPSFETALKTYAPQATPAPEWVPFAWEGEKPTVAELESHLTELEGRIDRGQALIQAYREAHQGTDNLRLMRQLQKLRREKAHVQQQLDVLASQRPLDFQAELRKRAQAAYQALLEMNLQREYDTPRYLEQEEIVRRYMREHEEGFAELCDFAGTL
jgi:hypothetical protein